jgi:hypothetical protein
MDEKNFISCSACTFQNTLTSTICAACSGSLDTSISCLTCTYINTANAISCVMCSTSLTNISQEKTQEIKIERKCICGTQTHSDPCYNCGLCSDNKWACDCIDSALHLESESDCNICNHENPQIQVLAQALEQERKRLQIRTQPQKKPLSTTEMNFISAILGPWSCLICTTNHINPHPECIMCETVNPAYTELLGEADIDEDSEWRCSKCNKICDYDDLSCCGNLSPLIKDAIRVKQQILGIQQNSMEIDNPVNTYTPDQIEEYMQKLVITPDLKECNNCEEQQSKVLCTNCNSSFCLDCIRNTLLHCNGDISVRCLAGCHQKYQIII